MMPFCLFFCLYNRRSFIWKKKQIKIIITKDILSTLRTGENVGKYSTMEWARFVCMSIRAEIVDFFFPLFLFRFVQNPFAAKRSTSIQYPVSNSEVVFIFACSIILILYWIFMSTHFNFRLCYQRCPAIDLIRFFTHRRQFSASFFSIFKKTLFCV